MTQFVAAGCVISPQLQVFLPSSADLIISNYCEVKLLSAKLRSVQGIQSLTM